MGVKQVHFIDGTLREGDQTAGVWFSLEDKLALFKRLQRAGVEVVDGGMPAISADERKLLTALSEQANRSTRIAASVRCLPKEVELAASCKVDEVFIIFPVSEGHRLRLDTTWPAWIKLGQQTLQRAKSLGLTINLVLEDASRAELSSLQQGLALARSGGAQRVMLCDTVGILTPNRARHLVLASRELLDAEIAIGTHFHDDFGMATANTIAAIEAGATWPSVTVNGLGERAGNAPLAEVAAACKNLLQIDSCIHLDQMMSLSQAVEALSGMLRAPNMPIVGERTFMHESGIHVHGLLKDPHTYEGLPAEAIKRQRHIVLGKHSGRAGLLAQLQKWGISSTDSDLSQLLEHIKSIPPQGQKEKTQRLLLAQKHFMVDGLGHNRQAIVKFLSQLGEADV